MAEENVILKIGNCLDVLRSMPDNSVDSCVTDPPYGLGFMAKKWDYDVPNVDVWREVLRVLKPGGHLLSFAGTRTQHRMAVNIEDAGFEIRDMIAWVYGSGFPKSHNVALAIDKQSDATGHRGKAFRTAGAGERLDIQDKNGVENIAYTAPVTEAAKQWAGWGTALKPALEPITVARKPFNNSVSTNVLEHGTGAINIDGCRVPYQGDYRSPARASGEVNSGGAFGTGVKPFNDEVAEAKGRWPANLIHDGSEEVLELFPKTRSGNNKGVYSYSGKEYDNKDTSTFNGDKPQSPSNYNDSGSASRFFYCSKASKKDRDEGLYHLSDSVLARSCQAIAEAKRGNTVEQSDGAFNKARMVKNNHPTVKPTDLMRYLCRLITPPNGIVLDPFMGSGSTGKAAIIEGFRFIGIEMDEEYMKIAEARIKHELDKYQNPLAKMLTDDENLSHF